MEIHDLSDFDDRDLESNIRNDHSNWNGRDIQLLDPFERVGMTGTVQKNNPILCMSRPPDESRGDLHADWDEARGFSTGVSWSWTWHNESDYEPTEDLGQNQIQTECNDSSTLVEEEDTTNK